MRKGRPRFLSSEKVFLLTLHVNRPSLIGEAKVSIPSESFPSWAARLAPWRAQVHSCGLPQATTGQYAPFLGPGVVKAEAPSSGSSNLTDFSRSQQLRLSPSWVGESGPVGSHHPNVYVLVCFRSYLSESPDLGPRGPSLCPESRPDPGVSCFILHGCWLGSLSDPGWNRVGQFPGNTVSFH